MNKRQKVLSWIAKGIRTELPKKTVTKYKTKTETKTEYIDPVLKVHKLQDDPNVCYVWQMREEASDYQMKNIIDNLYSEFVKKNGRDPLSLHLICRDISEIQKMDKESLQKIIVPWINSNHKQL